MTALLLNGCGERRAGTAAAAADSARTTATPPPPAPAMPAPPADSTRLRIDTIARGLVIPWAIAFAPDGRAFVTERPGRVRVIRDGRLEPAPWATFDVYVETQRIFPEAGLMGIALAPDFARTGHVYVMGTFWRDSTARSTSLGARLRRRARAMLPGREPSRWESRVYRCTDRGARAEGCEVVVGGLPASYYHAGGALAFGPDGMLYVTVGDALAPDAVRDAGALTSRVLRYTPDGRIPADNPVRGSPVFASGLRNSQGIAWHPDGHDAFAIDHGPSGMTQEHGRAGNDELDVLSPGADYGWPEVTGRAARAGSRDPVHVWPVAIAPAGLALYAGAWAPWRGDAFVTGLRGRTLRRLRLVRDGGGWRVARETEVLDGRHGRLRAVAVAPDGALWVTTSNRDVRGVAGPADDLVLRLTPLPDEPRAQARSSSASVRSPAR